MEYTQEQIDAMKKLMEAYNTLSEEAKTETNTAFDALFDMREAIKTLSEPMKDSLEGLSV